MNIKRLSSVSVGHFTIDVLNSSVAIIITVVAARFSLDNWQIGLGVTLYLLFGSLSQPFFGWLADRLSGRWLGAAGLLWSATFYALATYATHYTTLVALLALAALGSGAFHPLGTMVASNAGRSRASSATAIFFLLGQTGLALGPMLAGVLLERFDLPGARLMALAAIPVAAWMAYALWQPIESSAPHHAPAQPEPNDGAARQGVAQQMTAPAKADSKSAGGGQRTGRFAARSLQLVVAFCLLVALRATVQQGFYGLLPKFFSDQGYTSAAYGLLVGYFSLALAAGTLAGGILGDRLPHRQVLIWASLLTTPFTYAMVVTQGALYIAVALAAGFLLGIPHSILVVMAQRLLPGRQGLASGAVLGFMFASGAVGTLLVSGLADAITMAGALRWVSLLPLGAGASAFFLARRPFQAGKRAALATGD